MPGVKLNISKSGISTTIGKKGASVNITSNEMYLNTGVPGTGLYRRDKVSSKKVQNIRDANYKSEPSCLFLIYSLFRGFCTVLLVIALLGLIFNGNKYSTKEIITSIAGIVGFLALLYIMPIYRFLAKKVRSKATKIKPNTQSKEIDMINVHDTIMNIVPSYLSDISSDLFYNLKETIKPIIRLYGYFDKNETISSIIDNSLPYTFGDSSDKLSFLFHADVRKLFTLMGHSIDDLNNKEGFALLLLSYSILNSKRFLNTTYDDIKIIFYKVQPFKVNFDKTEKAFENYPRDDYFFIAEILKRSKRWDLIKQYFSCLYSFFKMVAIIDDDVSFEEKMWLEKVGDNARFN